MSKTLNTPSADDTSLADATFSAEGSAESRPTPAAAPMLRARTWVIGIPLLIGLCVLSVYADMSAQKIQFGVLAFSPPAVVGLFVLALVNIGWKSLTKRPLLSNAEMLVIYAMLLVGVMVSTRGIVEKLAGSIAYLPYGIAHTDPELKPFLSHVPGWIVPYDPNLPGVPKSVSGFFEGKSPVYWGAWIRPLAADFGLFALVILVFLCMGTILRRQWVDVEHLSFPLTSIPISLIRNESDGKPLLSSPLLWAGFAVSMLVFTLNGLHANYPTVPEIPTMFDIRALLPLPPWNSIGILQAYTSLAVIGFAYFMPSDVLFSLWFFYLLLQVQTVVASATGYPSNISSNWPPDEALGSYLVLTVSMVFSMRGHLSLVWKDAFGSEDGGKKIDSGELMSYRAALIGLVVGFVGIVVWLAFSGMNPLVALVVMGVYLFVTAFVMSRAVAQAGLLMTETSFIPTDLIQLFCPVASLGTATLTMAAFTNTWFSRDLRGELLAPIMDTQRTAGQIGQRPRVLLVPLLVAIVVAFCAATATFLHLNYSAGALNLYSHPIWSTSREFVQYAGNINGRVAQLTASWGAFLAGIATTILLVALRTRFVWFPFHPLGFALAPTWALIVFWWGFFVAWVIRSLVLGYGGFRLYRTLTPFMLGLILGEFSSAVLWSTLNMSLNVSTPQFPWP